jgi:chemotaxis receptor (MCP) glutamine deamidase CheD
MAREVLAGHGIPIVAERVEHNGGLRLFFESWTGTVWVRVHDKKGTP